MYILGITCIFVTYKAWQINTESWLYLTHSVTCKDLIFLLPVVCANLWPTSSIEQSALCKYWDAGPRGIKALDNKHAKTTFSVQSFRQRTWCWMTQVMMMMRTLPTHQKHLLRVERALSIMVGVIVSVVDHVTDRQCRFPKPKEVIYWITSLQLLLLICYFQAPLSLT